MERTLSHVGDHHARKLAESLTAAQYEHHDPVA